MDETVVVVPVDDFNSPATEEEVLDTSPLIEAYRQQQQADYERRLRNYLIGLYGVGGIAVLLASPPAFGAAVVVLDVYNFNIVLALFVSLIVVFDRAALIGFFLFPELKRFAKYLADKQRVPLTQKEFLIELGLYFLGAPSALFFAIFQFAMLKGFDVIIQKYKDTIGAVFIALAAFAITLEVGLATAIPAFFANLLGSPSMFRMAYKLFFDVMDDWRSFFTYTTRRRVRFGVENSFLVAILGVTIWGLSVYFDAAKSAFETYLRCPSQLAAVFAAYQMIIMSLVAFICSTLVGKKLGGFAFEIATRDFDGWPSRSQVAINTAIGIAAGILGGTASVQVIFAAIEDGLGVPQQVASGVASTVLEYMSLFGVGKLVEYGVRRVVEKCRQPKPPVAQVAQETKGWFDSGRAFFRKCCGGDNRGKGGIKLDGRTTSYQGASIPSMGATTGATL